jgi:lactoylglutathione lyase
MATRLGQYCINVSNLEKAVDFYENAIGLTITNRIEEEKFREVILGTEDGARLQLAFHKEEAGPIKHSNAFWKHYVYTDNCQELFDRAVAAGAGTMMPPMELKEWNVTIAMVTDLDGYNLEIVQNHD